MNPAPMVSRTLAANNGPSLHVGMELDSADCAREFVNAYAIHHNFAVKNGAVYDKTSHSCLCAKRQKAAADKGSADDNGLSRSMLCDCQWKVRFKKQLNDTWVGTQLIIMKITNCKV
ncbi:hypothetical protein V1522DRAFT_25713 [Lipomyces starkeyi]